MEYAPDTPERQGSSDGAAQWQVSYVDRLAKGTDNRSSLNSEKATQRSVTFVYFVDGIERKFSLIVNLNSNLASYPDAEDHFRSLALYSKLDGKLDGKY